MGTGGLLTIGHQQTFVCFCRLFSTPAYTLKIAQDINHQFFNFFVCLKRLCNHRLLRCFAHASQQRRHRSVSSYKPLLFVNRVAHTTLLYFGKCFPDFTPANALEKALVRLVSVGWKCCHSYTSDLSTLSSTTGLTSLCYERSHLTVGFVLICFQHLSTWNTATGRLLLAE